MDAVEVFELVVRLETELWNAVDARLEAELGLRLGRLDTMRVIDRTPGCRVLDVVAALSITVGGASKAVDRLEALGLCRRLPHPDDRRSSVLELTAEGRRQLAAGSALLRRDLEERFGRALDPAGLAALADALTRLRAAVRDGAGSGTTGDTGRERS